MKEMTLIEHLEELRIRVIRIALIVVVFFGACYFFSSDITAILLKPLRGAMGGQGKVVFTGLLDKIMSELQISFWSSLIVSAPFWFREVWLFIKPGLLDKEIKIIRPFIFTGFIMFCVGVAFGYFLVFPFVFKILLGYGLSDIEAMLNIKDYLTLSSKTLVLLGILFQLPNLMLILGFMGVVTHQALRSWRKYVAIIFAVASSILTPPDVISMMVLWLPMMALYEIGIWCVKIIVHPYLKRQHLPDTMDSE